MFGRPRWRGFGRRWRSLTSTLLVEGKPSACNDGLLSINFGLSWGTVACYFEQLGLPDLYPVVSYTSQRPQAGVG